MNVLYSSLHCLSVESVLCYYISRTAMIAEVRKLAMHNYCEIIRIRDGSISYSTNFKTRYQLIYPTSI